MKRLSKNFLILSVELLFILGFTSTLRATEDRTSACTNDPIVNLGKCKHDAVGDHYCDMDDNFLMNCDGDYNMGS